MEKFNTIFKLVLTIYIIFVIFSLALFMIVK